MVPKIRRERRMGFERVYQRVVHWVEVRGCHLGRRMACPKVGTMEN
jgi:hypothetical protein